MTKYLEEKWKVLGKLGYLLTVLGRVVSCPLVATRVRTRRLYTRWEHKLILPSKLNS